jgi:hypothetical protein
MSLRDTWRPDPGTGLLGTSRMASERGARDARDDRPLCEVFECTGCRHLQVQRVPDRPGQFRVIDRCNRCHQPVRSLGRAREGEQLPGATPITKGVLP